MKDKQEDISMQKIADAVGVKRVFLYKIQDKAINNFKKELQKRGIKVSDLIDCGKK